MPGPLVALAAPFLMKLAENGLGMLAGAIQAKGKEVIEEKIGVKIPDDPAKLTPELMQELQIKQMEHEEFLVEAGIRKQELELKETEAYLADRQSARGRDAEFIKAGKNNVRGDYLAYGALGALVADLIILTFVEVPVDNRDLLLVILGALIAIVKDVYGFEFGSSKEGAKSAQAVSEFLKNGHGK